MANKLLKTLNFGGSDTYDLAPDWKNVQNAPFGLDYTNGETLADNKTYSYSEDDGAYVIDFNIEPNFGYKVILNGTEYECITKNIEQEFGTMYYIGNGILFEAESTEEPFVIATMDMSALGSGVMNIMVFADGTTSDVTMTVIKCPIKKIPSAYYGEIEPICFYVHDGDTYLYKDISCTEKVAKDELQKALNSRVVYIKTNFTMSTISCVQNVLGQSHSVVWFNLLGTQTAAYTIEFTG